MKAHSAAAIFPLMTGAEFEALVEDIEQHGLREPIVVFDGLILDGRNRLAACERLGKTVATIAWDGLGSAEAYVVSKNLHRRHLNTSQRAMIAARLANRKREESLLIGRQQRNSPDTQICTSASVKQTATLLKVSPRSVSQAKRVLRDADATDVARIEKGERTVDSVVKRLPKTKPSTMKEAKRRDTLQMNAKLWRSFKFAIEALCSLPAPADVMRVVRGFDKGGLVERKLDQSYNWLKGFEHEWRNRD